MTGTERMDNMFKDLWSRTQEVLQNGDTTNSSTVAIPVADMAFLIAYAETQWLRSKAERGEIREVPTGSGSAFVPNNFPVGLLPDGKER